MVKKTLTDEAATWLVRRVSYEEIRQAMFKMNLDKSPGPDGYNAAFFQRNWNLVKGDVTSPILCFCDSGKLLKQINHTFIALVPKSDNASSLSDFRPISCCNVLYKLI